MALGTTSETGMITGQCVSGPAADTRVVGHYIHGMYGYYLDYFGEHFFFMWGGGLHGMMLQRNALAASLYI